MEEMHSTDIRKFRREVEGLGAILHRHGSQWILYGREPEPLGHSIKTERDALDFVLKARKHKAQSVLRTKEINFERWYS
jgi:hypothetical protein